MELHSTIIIIAVFALILFLLVAKRLLRFAIRLLLAGVILLALLVAIALGWWQGWFDRHSSREIPARPSPTRRVSSH